MLNGLGLKSLRRSRADNHMPILTELRWCPANDEGTKFFVGDSYGRLSLLSLESTAERGLLVIPLGEVQLFSPRIHNPDLTFVTRFRRLPQ
jgi:hypothetical protein